MEIDNGFIYKEETFQKICVLLLRFIRNCVSYISNTGIVWKSGMKMFENDINIYIHVSHFHRKICKLKMLIANKRWNAVIAGSDGGGEYLHFYVYVFPFISLSLYTSPFLSLAFTLTLSAIHLSLPIDNHKAYTQAFLAFTMILCFSPFKVFLYNYFFVNRRNLWMASSMCVEKPLLPSLFICIKRSQSCWEVCVCKRHKTISWIKKK